MSDCCSHECANVNIHEVRCQDARDQGYRRCGHSNSVLTSLRCPSIPACFSRTLILSVCHYACVSISCEPLSVGLYVSVCLTHAGIVSKLLSRSCDLPHNVHYRFWHIGFRRHVLCYRELYPNSELRKILLECRSVGACYRGLLYRSRLIGFCKVSTVSMVRV